MTQAKLLFLIGLLVMALPHLGFVGILENIIYFAFGLIILISAYSTYLDKKKRAEPPASLPVKSRTTRTRSIKKVPSPYLPPLVKEAPPEQSTGFVFVKKREDKTFS